MNQEEINRLDKYYFEKIKKAFEENGMTFIKTICSAFPISDTWENYGNKKSCFQEALERCIQSTITNNFDWEICGTPMGADSVFITPKAIIHIDAKCVLNSDNDAKTNCLSVGSNQTSYSAISIVSKNGKEFNTNLPAIYTHKIYGELVCLTYFIKVCYDRVFDENFCKKLSITLNSFPNGMLSDIYGINFLKIGKNNSAKLEYVLQDSEYRSHMRKCDDAGKTAFRTCYKRYTTDTYYLKEEYRDDKDELENLSEIYVEKLKRPDGTRGKKVNEKKFAIKDYYVLDTELVNFIDANYEEDDKDEILAYYDLYTGVFYLLSPEIKSEDKKKLQSAYKRIKLNTYAESIRIDFDKVTDDIDENSVFFWDHSQEIELM